MAKRTNTKQITMNKEFIPYEQALELKEIGFDENYIACYSSDGKLNPNDVWKHKDSVKAPLYQQAFRWFRDKHFRFNIGNDCTKVDGEYYYDVWRNGRFMYESDYIYKTYEEAQLACLNKLIEIIKNK